MTEAVPSPFRVARHTGGLQPSSWFVTAQYTRDKFAGGGINRFPSSMAHAKTMGTSHTACGLSAASWIKIWDLRFIDCTYEQCSRCLEVVFAEETARFGPPSFRAATA